MGTPEPGVITANTPLYAVFQRPTANRTHLAFNAGSAPISVRFSDGTVLAVPPFNSRSP